MWFFKFSDKVVFVSNAIKIELEKKVEFDRIGEIQFGCIDQGKQTKISVAIGKVKSESPHQGCVAQNVNGNIESESLIVHHRFVRVDRRDRVAGDHQEQNTEKKGR